MKNTHINRNLRATKGQSSILAACLSLLQLPTYSFSTPSVSHYHSEFECKKRTNNTEYAEFTAVNAQTATEE
jgi:hypothetical protein